GLLAPNLHVVQHGGRGHFTRLTGNDAPSWSRRSAGQRCPSLTARVGGCSTRIGIRRLRNDLDLWVLHQHRQLIDDEALVILGRYLDLGIPVILPDAGLLQEGVFHALIEQQEPVVLRPEHVIADVRRLLRGLYVLRVPGHTLNRILGAGKDLDDIRQRRIDDLGHQLANDLTTPRLLVAKRLAVVILVSHAPLLSDLPHREVAGGVALALQEGQQFVVGHRLVHTIQLALTFIGVGFGASFIPMAAYRKASAPWLAQSWTGSALSSPVRVFSSLR